MKIIQSLNNYTHKLGALIPLWFTPLMARLGIFFIFWNSAQTRLYDWKFLGYNWKFWELSETSFYLFEDFNLPLISAEIATYLATFGEFFLSLFILFGFFTRLSALGLLFMVLVIQLFAMPGSWQIHLLWGSVLIFLLKQGPGIISLDKLLKNN